MIFSTAKEATAARGKRKADGRALQVFQVLIPLGAELLMCFLKILPFNTRWSIFYIAVYSVFALSTRVCIVREACPDNFRHTVQEENPTGVFCAQLCLL
jgi:hypothetical protein